MVGWFADIDSLKSFLPESTTIKFNISLAFVFSGIIIYIMSKTRDTKIGYAKSIFALCGISIFMLMTVQLTSPFVGLHTGLESTFLKPTNAEINTVIDDTPSVLTIINFLFIIIISILEISIYSKLKKFLLLVGIFIMITGAICLIGYTLNIPSLYYSVEGWSAAMSIHAGILFTVIGFCFVIFGIQKEKEKIKKTSTIKLRTNLLLLFLIISLVPMIIIAATNYANEKVLLVKQTTTYLDIIADNTKDKVNNSIESAFAILSIVSNRPTLVQSLVDYDKNPTIDLQKQITTQIQSSKDAYSKFRDISLLNLKGVVIASTEPKYIDRIYANEDFFSRSINGQHYLDFVLDDDDKPTLELATPIYLNDKIIGVMSISADQDMIYPSTNYGNIGNTGEIVFGKKTSTGDAILISPLRYALDIQLIETFSNERPVAMNVALSKQEKILVDAVDYRNVPILAATRYIPITDWGLVVKMDQTEAFAPLEDIKNLVLFPTIFVSVLIIILSILFARTLSKSILQIRDASKNIMEDKFDMIETIDSKGEISELMELEQSFYSMASTTKTVNIQKDEFAAMISHELKTPLIPISGYAELFLDGSLGNITEIQKEKMQVMYENSIRLTTLIQDILDARKIELKRLNLDMQVESIKEIAKRCIDIFRPIAESKGIRLIDETQDIMIKCDPDRILQVLNNVVSNAMKFVPAQDGTILINSRIDKEIVMISIKDNGIGIPKSKQEDLFKKFYQVDKSLTRKSGGTGLGLAISRGIVEAHGGKIWVESEENQGTTVHFTIQKGNDK